MPSQEEYNVSMQQNRTLYTKIQLLNFNFQIVDELSGVLLDGSNFTIDADNDIRRTCTLSLISTDSSFNVYYGNKIWMDKYIKVFVGIKDIHTEKIVYTNIGIYLINNPSRVYDATNNTLTIQGIDLMSKLTGMRNGNLQGIEYVIPSNYNIKKAIISLLKLSGFMRYSVEECSINTPNELRFSLGSTVYDILSSLRNIMPNYQIYFDENGIFHYNLIPSGKNESIYVDDDLWNNTLISYNVDTNFENVKNYIEVFGKTHDVDNYASNCFFIQEQNTYIITVESILNQSNLYDGMKIGFVPDKDATKPYIRLLGFGKYDVALFNIDYGKSDGKLKKGQYYVIRVIDHYRAKFYGNLTPYGIAKDENEKSPFYVNGENGIIRIVLDGGEYDNIYTDELAQIRANWELYIRCRKLDSITITTVPIYWLDVNKLIKITLPTENMETKEYIIKSINTNLGIDGTQTINLMSYYSYYDN